jgi:hypothetical protein
MDETNRDETAGAGSEQALDDRGLDATGAQALLKRLRDVGFEGDNEKLSLTLGRPAEEIEAWMQGAEPPDDDIVMKARGIARERGLEIE